MKQILVTGSNGQLGSELQFLSQKYTQYKFFFTDVKELDITNIQELQTFFDAHNIGYIINCAAYTEVDKAEEEKEFANLLNHQAVSNLLEASEEKQSKLFQISTDYVFGGSHNVPLKEDLETKAESVYGISKLKGEKTALESGRAIVIRTSWLYSSYGNNFVKTIQKYARERDALSVVFDQVGTPTYARDLAQSILDIIDFTEEKNEFKAGVYHYANEGVLSWYDFAIEICNISHIDVKIEPVLSEQFPTPAKRPEYSVLDKTKIKSTFNISIPYWKDSLKTCIGIIEN